MHMCMCMCMCMHYRYVLFDWDTHFAAYMLSLDARELGYSVLIQATPRGL